MSYQHKYINKYGVVQIPKHWDLTILSRVADVIDPEPSHRAPAFAKGEGFPYVGIRDINFDGTVNIETARPIEEESLIEQEKRFIIEPSDIVFCRVATLGLPKILKTDKRIALSATLALIKSKKGIDYRYLLYYLESNVIKVQTALYATGSTRKSLGMETIRKFSVFVPPYEEQVEIAKYLKSKLDVIDSLISGKSNIINLLEEKRQSMITEAVTKGLSLNVKMKDSGVEWIGEIPEHWEKVKLKHLTRMKSGESIDALDIKPEGEYKVYGGGGFRGYTSKYTHAGEYVLIGRQGALCGNVTFASGEFWATEHAVVVEANYINIRFLRYLLECMNLNQYSISAAQPGLSVSTILNLTVPVPTKNEQVEIAAKLEDINVQTVQLVSDIQSQIQKLKEYRQSLIYEAVTGKIDVRDFEVKA